MSDKFDLAIKLTMHFVDGSKFTNFQSTGK